jgi:hypothetical protein
MMIVAVALAAPALALNSGTDILVPAAGRTGVFVTDLYIMNPGDSSVSVTLSWLVRGQANPNPVTTTFNLLPGETAVFDDVILDEFGLTDAGGAFLVEATGEVIANSRIYADEPGGTKGQGFEGVPVWAATGAGQTTHVVGLTQNPSFRTNVYALAGANGASISFSVRSPSGTVLGTTTLDLSAYEPYLDRVTRLFSGLPGFPNGTLFATVTSGSAVIGASKVDNASTDPTTLESAASGGGGSVDGTYQFALYDSFAFATGGNIVVENGMVTAINGTYANYDKLDGVDPACEVLFQWGLGLTPTPIEDFLPAEGGVTFSDDYTADDSGVMTWTVQFTVDDNLGLTGTVTAEGSDFTLPEETGCNGTFPPLDLFAGKTN